VNNAFTSDKTLKEGYVRDPCISRARHIHAFRRYPEYEPVDFYHVVIEWDALDRRIDMFDASDYERFITELA